jgi:hypothetical protein
MEFEIDQKELTFNASTNGKGPFVRVNKSLAHI